MKAQKDNPNHKRRNKTISALSERWFFLKLAFLALPWKSKLIANARGTGFTQYFLVEAKSIKSAFAKAERILSSSEHCEGDGVLNGQRVVFKKIGIIDLVPLYEVLRSGVELFDESEMGVKYIEIKRRVMKKKQIERAISNEEKYGKPALLDVNWGEGFDEL